jgi:hypothetical protein
MASRARAQCSTLARAVSPNARAALTVLATLPLPAIAHAQVLGAPLPEGGPAVIAPASNGVVMEASAPAVQDDVPWHETSAPYQGGPIRPGAQLDERMNVPFVSGGTIAIVVGLVLKAYGGGFANEPISLVPLVGPFVAGANAASTANDATNDISSTAAYYYIAGALEVLGTAALTYGLLFPRRTLVYAEPARRGFGMTMAMAPGAPGAAMGASLVGAF